MTRENKLALVVGFGLVLLVGILISDHFSEARTREPAPLTQAIDPLGAELDRDPDLIALRAAPMDQPGREAGRPGAGAASPERAVHPPVPRVVDPQIGLPEREAVALPWRFHHVQAGESLTSISIDYYGDATLIAELAEYNEIDDPDTVPAGRRLRIPPAAALVRRPSAASAIPPTVAAAPRPETRRYTVKEGDNLSTIAQRLLGSARAYTKIYDLNRDLLPSPDMVREGMVLKIPSSDSSG